MKITITNSKFAPFGKIPEGVVFKDTTAEDYYIKIASVIDEDTGAEDFNCLRLDNYALDCFDPTYLVLPIDSAELIIP